MSAIFEHGYAVVIGVDENNIARLALPTVAKDVNAIHDVLVHPERCAYKPENVRLLKGADSTAKNIREALFWLRDVVNEDADATAVVYYSGHGMVDKATDQYYLIPYDIHSLTRVRADAIKAEELTATIGEIAAKRMLVILDCCHAAGMEIKEVDLAAIGDGANVEARPFPIDLPETKAIPVFDAAPGDKAVSDLLDGEGRAVLNSSTGAQSSYVRRDGKMSLFTYHLIEALTGHAPHPDDATVVYVTDVMSWVTHEVKKSAAREEVAQTPVMRTSGVFPVAQLLGGQGVAVSKGEAAPDPLEALPDQTAAGGIQAGRDVIGGSKIKIGSVTGSSIAGAGGTATTTNFSGDFQGAIVTHGSTLQNVTQTINNMRAADEPTKQRLAGLVNEQRSLLQTASPANQPAAKQLTEATSLLLAQAGAATPNEMMVKLMGDGLKQQALALQDELPRVVTLTAEIVTAVNQIAGTQ